MSTESSILDLILRIRKAGTGTKETQEDLDKLKRKTEESNDAFGGMVRGLADVKAGMDIFGQALAIAQQAFDATVMKAANWGDEMGDLSQLTGTSVRETSELAATLELLGIKQEGLTKIVKAFTAQGLQPTMANIRALAAEYQAIQDPVEKNEFLFKRFGKQAGDVAEILGKSSDELDQFTAAARASGKVIDEQTAAAAEHLNVNLAKLQQRFEGIGITVGNFFIPTINDLFDGVDTLTQAAQRGDITWLEYANRLATVATGHGTAATLTAGLSDEVERLKDDTAQLTTATDVNTVAWTNMTPPMDVARAAMETTAAVARDQLQKSLDDLTGAASDLKFGMGELTTATLFNQAAAGLDEEASLRLAKAMGLIKPDAEAAKQILDDLRYQLEHGQISAGQYEGQVKLLDLAIRSLPDGKTITVTYVQQYIKDMNADPTLGTNGGQRQYGGAVGDGYAEGGSFVVPPGFPNDTYPLRVSSGEMVTIVPKNQVTTNYNLTVNTAAGSMGVVSDFALMRALSGV